MALKLFSPRENAPSDKWEALRRSFRNESRKTQFVTHWNIIKITDSGEAVLNSDKLPFSVMELALGDLNAILANRIGFVEKLFYSAQLTESVNYINRSKGLIHRDIKPENILLGSDGLMKVADLGIAEIIPEFEMTQLGLGLYTEQTDIKHPRHYFSPEQLRRVEGDKKVDLGRSDIFQLGKVLHRIFTGVNPVGQINLKQDLYSGLPTLLLELIANMLAQIPSDRPSLEYCTAALYIELERTLNQLNANASKLSSFAKEQMAELFSDKDAFNARTDAYYGFDEFANFVDVRNDRGQVPQWVSNEEVVITLTDRGIDLKNMILGTEKWLHLMDRYSKLERAPNEGSIFTMENEARRETFRDFVLYRGRKVGMHSSFSVKAKRVSCHVVQPLAISDAWWVEAFDIVPDVLRPYDPNPDWGLPYTAPWRIASGSTIGAALLNMRKQLVAEGVNKREADKILSAFVLNRKNTTRSKLTGCSFQRLTSLRFWDNVVASMCAKPFVCWLWPEKSYRRDLWTLVVDSSARSKREFRASEFANLQFRDLINLIHAERPLTHLKSLLDLRIPPRFVVERYLLPLFFRMILDLGLCVPYTLLIDAGEMRWQIAFVNALTGSEVSDLARGFYDFMTSEEKEPSRMRRLYRKSVPRYMTYLWRSYSRVRKGFGSAT